MNKVTAILNKLKFYFLSNRALIEHTIEFVSQIKTLWQLYGYLVIKAIHTIIKFFSNK